MGKLTLSKEVPAEITNQYLNYGWQTNPQEKGPGVWKTIETGSEHNQNEHIEFRQPYLVQRALINRPLGQYDGDTFTRAIRLDYMGAAEFEYGAIPLSLRRIQAQFTMFKEYKIDQIKMKDNQDRSFILRVWANFDTTEQFNKYVGWLTEMREGTFKDLHEWTDFDLNTNRLGKDPVRTDLWWDIVNDVIWSFDKNFMCRIERHMMASFIQLDQRAVVSKTLSKV